jgi:hypothetical protein
MAKVGLTKLGLKKNTDVINLTWNGQIIEIKAYLPIEEKLEMISRIVNFSLDENNFANPGRIEIFTLLEVMYAYTNINFTDKQKENFLELYDMIFSSGLWAEIKNILGNELNIITTTTDEVIHEVYSYKNSALGILQAIVEDYEELDLDADKLKAKIADKDNLKTLKNVMDKLG